MKPNKTSNRGAVVNSAPCCQEIDDGRYLYVVGVKIDLHELYNYKIITFVKYSKERILMNLAICE